ncbi:MAG: hypothetical protein LBH70_05735 [Spirochaetaceae bacterium]|nr:hypothetical protein [Spirochaetaceae bacterium]
MKKLRRYYDGGKRGLLLGAVFFSYADGEETGNCRRPLLRLDFCYDYYNTYIIIPMKTPQCNAVIFLVPLFVFNILFFASAQTQGGGAVFAPFVSLLRGEVEHNLIRLSWIDSRDVRGPVFIYRSQTPFDTEHPYHLVQPIEAPYGAQSYLDTVETAGQWHYFVAASDERGRLYEIFMPYGNTVTVTVEEIQRESSRFVQNSGAPSKITGLEAAVQGDGVLISFTLSAPVRNLALYRSVNPITNLQELLNAVFVENGVLSPFMDYPVPGIPYYYAVITEDELISGNMEIYPGSNATVTAVEVSAGSRIGLVPSPGIRAIPLPLISASTISPSGNYENVPPPALLSPEAAWAVNSLNLRRTAPLPPKIPRVFEQDLAPPSGGEERGLRSIVQGSFRSRDWPVCRDELVQYLSLPHSAASEVRARFYLAQAHYFNGSYREALFEFLSAQSHYPKETQEWVQAALLMLIQKPLNTANTAASPAVPD